MAISKSKIKKIAEETRAEITKNRFALWGSNIIKLDLGGICYYASILLCHKLKEAGLPAETVSGQGHWFVKCGTWLVDITASQFGQGKVCIRNFEETQKKAKKGEVRIGFWKARKIGNYSDTGLNMWVPKIEQVFGIKVK